MSTLQEMEKLLAYMNANKQLFEAETTIGASLEEHRAFECSCNIDRV